MSLFRVWQFVTIGYACINYFIVYFYKFSPSVLADYFTDEDFEQGPHFTESQFSSYNSCYYYPYAVMQMFGGLLSDIFPQRIILFIFQLLSMIGMFISAATNDYAAMCIARFLIGIGTGPIYVPASRLEGLWIPPKWYPVSNGFLLAIGAAGGLVAQTPLALLAEKFIAKDASQWKYIFWIFGAIGGGIALGDLVFIKESPENIGYNKYGERVEPKPKPPKEPVLQVLKTKLIQLGKNCKTVMSNPQFWPVACWSGLNTSVYFLFTTSLSTKWQTKALGKEQNRAATNNLFLSFAWVFGSPIALFVSDLLHSRKWMLVGGSAVSVACGLVIVFVDDNKLKNGVLMILFLLWAIGNSTLIGVALAMNKEQQPLTLQSSAMGIGNGCPALVCAILYNIQPVALNAVLGDGSHEHSDYRRAYNYTFWIPAIVMNGLGGIAAIFAKETFGTQPEDLDVEKKSSSSGHKAADSAKVQPDDALQI